MISTTKTREFGGEGLRKWDLLRRGLDYAGDKINASFIIPSGPPKLRTLHPVHLRQIRGACSRFLPVK
jgi:hypothetical protein